jgi:hypothetical protein
MVAQTFISNLYFLTHMMPHPSRRIQRFAMTASKPRLIHPTVIQLARARRCPRRAALEEL